MQRINMETFVSILMRCILFQNNIPLDQFIMKAVSQENGLQK